MYPLVHEYLKNNKYNSYLSLHPNIEMLGLPVFYKSDLEQVYRVNIFDTSKLGYKARGEYLGFGMELKEVKDQKAGIELLQSLISKYKSVIVSGSQYFLPYSNNYKNDHYIKNYPNPLYGIVNHWIIIYGLKNEEVFIRDSALNYFGVISKTDFLNFWGGDKQITEFKQIQDNNVLLENGYINININKKLTIEDFNYLLIKTLKTICYEYIAGRQIKINGSSFYFGRKALNELYNSIENQDITQKLALDSFNTCLYNLRFNRLIFRDLLLEIKNVMGGSYSNFLDLYSDIQKKQENLSFVYALNMVRNKMNYENILKFQNNFKEYIENETVFVNFVLASLGSIPLLEKD